MTEEHGLSLRSVRAVPARRRRSVLAAFHAASWFIHLGTARARRARSGHPDRSGEPFPAIGNLFHWLGGWPGFFPDVPLTLPPGSTSSLSGQLWDFLGVALDTTGQIAGATAPRLWAGLLAFAVLLPAGAAQAMTQIRFGQ